MNKPKKPSVFMKPMQISDTLAAVVGPGPMPRTEVAKKIWEYIKKHELQSQSNRRLIEPDALLAKVLGSSQPIDMFQMTSAIAKHIYSEEAVTPK